MNVSKSAKVVVITITLEGREAKLLACLVGALSPTDAEDIIKRGIYFNDWLGALQNKEVTTFTGDLYDELHSVLTDY